MTPFTNVLDPFGGAAFPGTPMDAVLSLQTFEDVDAVGVVEYKYNSSGCQNVGDTASCYTNTCTTVGITDSCNTIGCTHR